MRAALGVVRVGADPAANLVVLLDMLDEAATQGAELVLFPEAVLTGLINDDDPMHDLPLGQSIPGQATGAVSARAKAFGIWVGFGLLERAGEALYDSAVLIDAKGELRLAYRRVNPQWHGRKAVPDVYRQGDRVRAVKTPWGRMAFLICGDLFDDAVVAEARALAPDWLLFPFARSFAGGGASQGRWDTEEMPAYAARVKAAGAPALMVNLLADERELPEEGSFGGAFVVRADGTVAAQKPLGAPGLLVVDLP